MDRKISTEFAKQRRNKKIIKIVMSVVVSITIFIVIINLTKPSINLYWRSYFRIGFRVFLSRGNGAKRRVATKTS